MAKQLDLAARLPRPLAGENVVRRYRAGLLKDHDYVTDFLALTGLLAKDNPLCAVAWSTQSGERRTSSTATRRH